MNLLINIFFLIFVFLLSGCADYKTTKNNKNAQKKFYSSNGFALVYDDNLFATGGINKKIKNNDDIVIMHSFLKRNTPVQIINPTNSKVVVSEVMSRAEYPSFFNIVLSKKIAEILELDINNPYVEVFEIKKNKKFVAKESNMFEEEKNVAETAPVEEIKVDDLSENKTEKKKKNINKSIFTIIISDFYYVDSATNLKNELIKKTNINKFSVKKINDNKYRLSVGPFKNFNSLKSTYISLNNLGFENLNIYKK